MMKIKSTQIVQSPDGSNAITYDLTGKKGINNRARVLPND